LANRWANSSIYCTGKWFESHPGKREKIFLATKFANKVDENGNRSVDSSPEYARAACEKSLGRLKVKQIDLYYAHREYHKAVISRVEVIY
jgi:aryl-alcohol dehydrogenase-like predicted oxidoreductase